jgi:hypothetical protein
MAVFLTELLNLFLMQFADLHQIRITDEEF